MTDPIKLASGKFAMYQTDRGGLHLTLQVDGEEEPRHMELPPMMVKLMMRKMGSDTMKEMAETNDLTPGIMEITAPLLTDEELVPDAVD